MFSLQWGLGLLIDALRSLGADEIFAFRAAFAGFWVCSVLAYLWFLRGRRQAVDNQGRDLT